MEEDNTTFYQRVLSVVSESTKSEQHKLAREVVDGFVDNDLDDIRCFCEGGIIYDNSNLTCSDFLDADRFSWHMYGESEEMPTTITVEVNAKVKDTARVDLPTPTVQTQSPPGPGHMTFVECILSFELEITPHERETDAMVSIMEADEMQPD